MFANVPFAVTSAVITRLASAAVPPEDSYLVVQREAAERFIGRPVGTLYAALLHPHLELSVLYRFARSDFAPSPQRRCRDAPPAQARTAPAARCRTSGLSRLRDPLLYVPAPHAAGTLAAILGVRAACRILSPLGIAPEARPSTVSVEHWPTLWSGFRLLGGVEAGREVAGAERRLRQQQEGLRKMHRTIDREAASRAERAGRRGFVTRRPGICTRLNSRSSAISGLIRSLGPWPPGLRRSTSSIARNFALQQALWALKAETRRICRIG